MVREIRLNNSRMCALVDDEDYALVARCSWSLVSDNYVMGCIDGKPIYMHRMILGLDDNRVADHKNGIHWDNTRVNLRVATRSQNSASARRPKSANGYKGIYRTASGKFAAKIGVGGRQQYLGSFDTPQDAAQAYDEAARTIFGEFARTNFP